MKAHQSWVTSASDDVEGIKALILARSLRRGITTRLLTIFVSHQVSEEIKLLLEDEFDRCITIAKNQLNEYSGLPFNTVAKINCWNLSKLKKFVFLDCNCMVLINSDELFKQQGIVASRKVVSDGTETSLIVDSPSKSKFKKFVNAVKSKTFKWENELDFLDSSLEKGLDQKYSVCINLQSNNLKANVSKLNIVCFTDTHPVDIVSDIKEETSTVQGILEKALFDIAMECLVADDLYLHNKISTVLKATSWMVRKMEALRTAANPSLNFKHLEELQDSVAIVGMSFRFPGANNMDEFWDLLINGREGIIKVPDGRWNPNQCLIRAENTKETQAGFLNCPIDEIDAKFFGLSPMEVSYMDPQQRLTLQVMWEAFEHAGINPVHLKNSKTGVFGGWWRNDYKEMLQEAGLNEQEFFRTYMGNSLGTLTGRISHILELTGPSISTESGCSTSIVAVDMACKSLLNEDCDVGLAFGVNLLLHPFSIHTMNSVIAMDGRCKTFDANADGFGRAEGCSVLVLKRFSDAVRDGDRVWGLIRGSAVVQEGPSRSLGTPTVQCESLAMELALEDAGVEPKDVSFVETHGTGTPVGDPLEVKAVAEVYSKDRKTPLIIGSVKTNIGHTESCSGIAGIIKTVLALHHQAIPPHRNFETLNPDINLEEIPAVIPLTPYQWKKNILSKPRIAGVSSFGITGTDAHVIIQETPAVLQSGIRLQSDLPQKIMKLSAKTPEALHDLKISFSALLAKTNENLNDFCYTANTGRGDFQHRSVFIGSEKSEIQKQLDKQVSEITPVLPEPRKTCFIFTGQGSQYPGMAKSIYEHSPIFKIHFDNCNQILFQKLGISIKDAIWGDRVDDLSRTIYSQTSIFCIEYCLLKLWESWGVKPDFVLGHSLGEFAAAVSAEILSFEDALTLVAERSRLIDSLPGGKMLVIKESQEKVDAMLKVAFAGSKNWLDYAAINSEEQTVLAGSEENIRQFAMFCGNNKIKTHILQATHAFHSRHMEPILEEYRTKASKLNYAEAKCNYISGMDGKIKDAGAIDADYWVRHTREPVRFTEASKVVLENGNTIFVEIGPQPVLSALIMMNADTFGSDPVTCLPSMRKNEDEWLTILSTLGKLYVNGLDINWKNFHQFSGGEIVTLPFYQFQNKSHWFDIKGDRHRPIHSLVGTPVPNASNLKLFQNQLNLYNTPYLKDHAIGNTIIMPGAGFLEMCLVAGHAAYQCLEGGYMPPNTPVTLEDFVIEGPLALDENEQTQTQVVVTTEEAGETRVTIYSKLTLDKETHKWIRHASGVFSPYAVLSQKEELNIDDTLENIKTRCTDKLVTDETYDKFLEYGLKFGPTFRNLREAYQGEDEILFEICQPDLNTDSYILHPAIIDAVFQAIAIASNPDANQLQVPISVTKFIWHAKLTSQFSYIHSRKDTQSSNGDRVAVLYDNNGQRIATIIGASFMETNVSTVMSAIEAQRTSLPSMYQEAWREQLGHCERRVSKLSSTARIYSKEYEESNFNFNSINEEGQQFYDTSNRLSSLYMIKALCDLGWNPRIGQVSTIKKLLTSLNIQPSFERLTRYMLTVLVEEGYLKANNTLDDIEFEVRRAIPSCERVSQDIKKWYLQSNPEKYIEAVSIAAVANNLGEIISGKQLALPILFPEDPNETGPAEKYYFNSEMNKSVLKVAEELFPVLMAEFKEPLEVQKKVLRILEVGAGTGSFTKMILKHLTAPPSAYEYTYTDISQVFFAKGEKIFENSKIKVIYKTLNIEEDPTIQGFIPHHYDMIFASFVVHATKDVKKSISVLRNLLRPNGCLMITELTKPLRGMNLVFGVLEGFWAFTDSDLRPHNCEMSADKWEVVLKECGFVTTAKYGAYMDHCAVITGGLSDEIDYIPIHPTLQSSKTWLIFSNEDTSSAVLHNKLSQIGRNVVLVTRSHKGPKILDSNHFQIGSNDTMDMQNLFKEVFPESKTRLEGIIYLWGLDNNEEDVQSVCRPFLNLCQICLTLDHTKLLVVTKGTLSLGDHEIDSPFSSPLIGMTKALQNENHSLLCRCIDIDPTNSSIETTMEAFSEIFTNDSELLVAYRGNRRNVPRFIPCKIPNSSLSFPKTDRSRLILPSSNAIQDLRFGTASKREIGRNAVEIRVKAFALNFRDVLVVLKPSPEFEDWHTVGIDFSGVVTAIGSDVTLHTVGDAVLGTNMNGDALPSHIVSAEDLVMPVPKGMTFNEAATLPAVAATVYLCLIEGGKLKERDTILIHTGSGGVGCCAIQVAKSLNCNIVATAGSVRKRAYLRHLGIKHVFNSRNTEYGTQIRDALDGEGVDFVLNSLTGAGFKEATLGLCKPGARFVEMSKLNIWTPEEVTKLRPDVHYQVVDLSVAPESEIKEYMLEIRKHMDQSTLKPIPYVRFDASDIRAALTYLQKAKHIGKIICEMPQPSSIKGSHDLEMPLFNNRSCYLITGGLGGIGIEIAKWMARSGAQHIVLVGRNEPKEKASEEIKVLKSKGINIVVMQCDITDFNQCKSLLESLKSEAVNLPTLRGIMHSAGVLSDGMYESQTWEKYEEALNPKIKGGWNLHLLTLDYPLEHFVMFSSAVGLFGSLGQSNHAAANVFLDSFAQYRNSIGLPATTINWGQWGQVGVAANLDVVGLKPMTPLQCVSALEKLMKNQQLQTCVCEANFSVVKKVFPINKKYLSELKDTHIEKVEGLKVNSEEFWKEYDASNVTEDRVLVVKKYIRSVIRQVLKLDEGDKIDDDGNLQEMGMDSLMMIEMKNVLQSLVGDRAKITVNSVKDCTTISQLATRIVDLVSGVEELPPPTREELNQLIREDAELSSNVKPQGAGCRPSDIRSVLITGVTGNLGPYILQEILKRPHVQKVYCLMRGNLKASPKARLTKMLAEKNVELDNHLEVLECVTGNVIQKNFGMDEETYLRLAEDVDAVFHLAVKASFQELYRSSPAADRDIRTVNVIGTKHVLEFACKTKTKLVYHASATLAVAKLDEDHRMSENWPQINDFDEMPNDAYPISKFIADRLMAQAVERGVPCKVFRFPFIGGDSKTGGNISVLNNSLLLRMMAYMHLGIMPAISVPFMAIPVDVCAEISTRIFFNDETGYEVYNVHNPKVNDEQELEDIAEEFGFTVETVEPDDFIDKVSKMENSEVLLIIKKGVENTETRQQLEDNIPPAIEAWITGQKDVFLSKKLQKLIPEYPECMETALDILKRDLWHAKNSGLFGKLGLEEK